MEINWKCRQTYSIFFQVQFSAHLKSLILERPRGRFDQCYNFYYYEVFFLFVTLLTLIQSILAKFIIKSELKSLTYLKYKLIITEVAKLTKNDLFVILALTQPIAKHVWCGCTTTQVLDQSHERYEHSAGDVTPCIYYCVWRMICSFTLLR